MKTRWWAIGASFVACAFGECKVAILAASFRLASSQIATKNLQCALFSSLAQTTLGMSDAVHYSAVERCRNGQSIEIRALKPTDRPAMLPAVGRTRAASLYRRFFGSKRTFSEREIVHFLNIDYVNHVALVAVTQQDGQDIIIGGGRYIVVQRDTAELAFTVVDEYQGQGIGTALMRHLVKLACNAGIKELVADVLPDNAPMLKVFERSGLGIRTTREATQFMLHLSYDEGLLSCKAQGDGSSFAGSI
jgi:RimJ/RimL family protein N-acetyltransferase